MRILALWDYARPNWVAPLEGLVARGHEVIYLEYRSRDREPAHLGIPDERERHYWNEFRSAQHLLRRIKPDRVVLMGTEGAWALSAIAAARRRQIPTAVLQHGILGPPESLLPLTASVLALATARRYERLPAVLFVCRTLMNQPGELIKALRYLRAAAMSTAWKAAPLHPLESRQTDLYLVASERAKRFYRAMDHVEEDRFVEVGLPEFDDLLTQQAPNRQSNHALLIDTPHTGTPHGVGSITGVEKSKHISRIASDLADHGWSLTVKLHPSSYQDTWPVDGRSLQYIREAELASLIGSASVVLGFDSTLFVAALLYRPALIVTMDGAGTWFSDLAVELGATRPPISMLEVSADQIIKAAANDEATLTGRLRLVEALIGTPVGRSLERIERALQQARVAVSE